MTYGAGSRCHQLLSCLVGKAWHRGIIQPVWNAKRLIPPERSDISRLPFKVDRIFRVDFKLRGDLRRQRQEFGPDAADFRDCRFAG